MSVAPPTQGSRPGCPLSPSETTAYEHAYRLAMIGDDIRNYLRSIEIGIYDGPPVKTPMGVFRTDAPVGTDEDRDKVRKVVRDCVRQARSSLALLEAAMGMSKSKGGLP